ncbi:TPA: hypothetical protein ND482_001645 [Citrobacter farmeri]|nr:hypothetical protein [Citrobacter farmeri]
MINALKDYLCHIARTFFHMYQQPFNELWDQKLLRALNAGEIIFVEKHTITFSCDGDVLQVWTSNRWYAYAYLYQLNGEYVDESLKARPRFRTMRLLYEIERAVRISPVTRRDFYDRLGASDV